MPAMHVINTLLPVFAVIALGAYLQKTDFVSFEFVKGLNRLVYWVGLPCLLFYKVASAPYDFSRAGKTFVVVVIGILGCIIIGYAVAFVIRIRPKAVGTFIQGAYRGNFFYVGLSVIIYSFSNSGEFDAAVMETTAILVMALVVPIHNIIAVVVLLASGHKIDRHVPGKILRQVITNPLFVSCLAGVVYSVLLPQLPSVVVRTCTAVGQVSLPLALLSIGATLVERRVAGRRASAFAAAIIKIAAAPLIGLLAANLIGLGAGETRIALIFLACPTAVVSYVMAEQLGGDEQLAASIVVLTTLLSVLSLSLVVGLF